MSNVTGDRHRADRFVLAWCHWYTRGLPRSVADDRCGELIADLYDHRQDAASCGTASREVATSILVRSILGVPADLSWRTHQRRAARSAVAREEVMSVTGRDGWSITAYALGAVVMVWSLFVSTTLISVTEATSDDKSWRIMVGSGAVACVLLAAFGLWAMKRMPVAASVAMGVAAIVSTVWMLWAPLVAFIGVSITVFFIAYAVHTKRATQGVHSLQASIT